jgi:hypothetical protein
MLVSIFTNMTLWEADSRGHRRRDARLLARGGIVADLVVLLQYGLFLCYDASSSHVDEDGSFALEIFEVVVSGRELGREGSDE